MTWDDWDDEDTGPYDPDLYELAVMWWGRLRARVRALTQAVRSFAPSRGS
jgi:hypothetical protein